MECWLANIPQKGVGEKRRFNFLFIKPGIGQRQPDDFMGHVPDPPIRVFVEPDHAQSNNVDVCHPLMISLISNH
jgi:hypothetical protein